MTNTKGTRNYMRNFQTKKRRRREGKTDYQHRTNLLRQDCTHHNNVKSRLVVRITNNRVICSITKAFIDGDRVVAYADSTELKEYGIEFGLTNQFAAYATGFLCGRRALKSNGLDKIYQPNTNVGEYAITEDKDEEHAAYKVFLDIGLARASKGANVFIAMKGASDAGLQIPHSESKFYGYDKAKGLDANELRNRIFMKHNIEYMNELKSNDEEAYKRQFGKYISLGINPEDIEGKFQSCLAQIAEDPIKNKKSKDVSRKHYNNKVPKLTLEERKERVRAKLAAAQE
jgi:large subunit ribosomal protein L5e